MPRGPNVVRASCNARRQAAAVWVRTIDALSTCAGATPIRLNTACPSRLTRVPVPAALVLRLMAGVPVPVVAI